MGAMRLFKDSATGKIYGFGPEVTVSEAAGVYSFAVAGKPLSKPKTLQPYVAPVPTPAELLAAAQGAQSAKLRAACAAAITGGFTCAALAAGYFYASTPTDQANLAAAAIVAGSAPAGWSTPIWCEAAPGAVWEFEEHNAAQVMAVHAACQAMIAGARAQLKVLLGQVQAAATPAEVAAAVWPAA